VRQSSTTGLFFLGTVLSSGQLRSGAARPVRDRLDKARSCVDSEPLKSRPRIAAGYDDDHESGKNLQ